MSDQTSNSGASSVSTFVLAAAVLALAIVLWLVFGGAFSQDEPDVSITVPGVGTVEGTVNSDG